MTSYRDSLRYCVVGVDDDGDEVVLRETSQLVEANAQFVNYVTKEDAGGWDCVRLVDAEAGPQSPYYVVRDWERP